MNHHPHGPSALENQSRCPGSHRLSKDLPDKTGPDALRGTMLHKATDPSFDLDGLGWDDRRHVELARAIIGEITEGAESVEYEVKLFLRNQQDQVVTWGTCDVRAIFDHGHVAVVELKFGHSPVPEARDNIQVLTYLAAAMQEEDALSGSAHIIQPCAWPRTTACEISSSEAELFINETIDDVEAIIEECEDPFAMCNPGYEQCAYCRAALTCETRKKHIADAIDVTIEGHQYDSFQMLKLMALHKEVGQWHRQMDAALKEAYRAGMVPDGYETYEKKGNREVDWDLLMETLGGDEDSFLDRIPLKVSYAVTRDAYVEANQGDRSKKATEEELNILAGDAITRKAASIQIRKQK